FLEAIRQLFLEVGAQNVVNVHVTLVPYIKAAHELKTKPTQQSVAKLREIGLQPQVLICRTEKPLDRDVRQKLSMFCSVSEKAVIEARDVEHTVYEYPLMLHTEGLDQLVCHLLHLKTPEPDLANWRKFVERVISPKKQVTIAVVGKYIDLQDAYKSIYESLTHAATSEFARNVCGLKGANSTEFDKDATEPVISLLEEQRGIHNKGASMRLGTWPTKIMKGTLAESIYGSGEVMERHRHRYEFNMKY